MASLATPADLIKRYRSSNIEQVANDDGVAEQEEDLETNPRVLQALADATGAVKVALMTGGKYTVEQLEELEDESADHLKRIVCEIAYANLVNRVEPGAETTLALMERAEKWLEDLRKGVNVFGIPEKIEAGRPKVSGPSVTSYMAKRRILTRGPMSRFFPNPGDSFPSNRQN